MPSKHSFLVLECLFGRVTYSLCLVWFISLFLCLLAPVPAVHSVRLHSAEEVLSHQGLHLMALSAERLSHPPVLHKPLVPSGA
jgi:hypothetical protein